MQREKNIHEILEGKESLFYVQPWKTIFYTFNSLDTNDLDAERT